MPVVVDIFVIESNSRKGVGEEIKCKIGLDRKSTKMTYDSSLHFLSCMAQNCTKKVTYNLHLKSLAVFRIFTIYTLNMAALRYPAGIFNWGFFSLLCN
jgi:hypothetical protein